MWLWIIATVVAYFVKGLCGFANTLVFTSILGFGADNINISPVDLLLGFPPNIILTVKNRKKLDPKVCIPLIILVLAGSIPGAFLLKNINAQLIKIIFGAVVAFVGIEMLLRERGIYIIPESKIIFAIIGLLSGVLCGLFGVGALLAAYISRATNTGDGFKANISAVFIADNIFRIILYSCMGVITVSSLIHTLILIPFMLLGLFLGMKLSKVLNEKTARFLVVVMLVFSGVFLIVKNA